MGQTRYAIRFGEFCACGLLALELMQFRSPCGLSKKLHPINKVRASRDGHEFHEAWAARKALQLVIPIDGLIGIAVEGLAPADQ